MTSSLAVTGWEVLSPYGFGAAAFESGVRAGTAGLRSSTADSGYPQPFLGTLDGFDVRNRLGRKGTRSMDRATGLAVATVGMLLERHRGGTTELTGDETALVLGTTTGSAKSMMDFTYDSLVGDKPYHVDPARFPNTVMNCAAGQCAIWHHLTGPNTTIAGGRPTVLSALNYAQRLHRGGHAATVLCGAVEELSERRAWLEWHARQSDTRGAAAIGEACAMFVLESAEHARTHGRTPHAQLLASTFLTRGPEEPPAEAVADAVRRCLRRARLEPSEVAVLAAEEQDGPLREQLGWTADRPYRISVGPLIGDTGAVSAGMQLAAVLSIAADGPADRTAMIVSADPDGTVGALALRLRPTDTRIEVGDELR